MRQRTVRRSVFLLSLAAAIPALSQPTPLADKAAPAMRPFAYGDVTLLDGPFLEARKRTEEYILSVDPDRLLHTFRLNAGLPSSAKPLGGWEAPDVELRGHSIGHYLTACALMLSATNDSRFRAKGEYVVEQLAKVQVALARKGATPGFLSAFPEEFIERVETRKRVWAPYYTLHKIMAGLLDMYLHCGSTTALTVVRRQADWVRTRMSRLDRSQQQEMLQTEFGGMTEVLANLAATTGEEKYLECSRLFDHEAVLGPLSRGVDSLDGLHGNTQIPKAIGALLQYERTGERRYYDVARFFWERVSGPRAYVIGGNTNDEHFFPVEQFAYHLGSASTETCNSYNMMRLSRGLLQHAPSGRIGDFMERVLINHILASQDPATGMMCYYVPMRPGLFKTFSTPDSSFWCCVGTGIENPARYTESLYFHDAGTILVNLFVPSEVTWREKRVTIRQETMFPETGSTRLSIVADREVRFVLRVRYPSWSTTKAAVTVNGRDIPMTSGPGTFIGIDRTWKTGDVIECVFPMTLEVERMPHDSGLIAFRYGPVVLAGDLGDAGLTEENQYGPYAPAARAVPEIEVPTVVTDDQDGLLRHLEPVKDRPATFRTVGLMHPYDVTLAPFYQTFHSRYSVYWRVRSTREHRRAVEQERERAARRERMERQTIDRVDVHDRATELAHRFEGEKTRDHWYDDRRGRESSDGWFSYEMTVDSNAAMILLCTLRGGTKQAGGFEIVVNGTTIGSEHPDRESPAFYDREFRIPASVTGSSSKARILFRPKPGGVAGPIFEVRTVTDERERE